MHLFAVVACGDRAEATTGVGFVALVDCKRMHDKVGHIYVLMYDVHSKKILGE